MSGRGPGQAQGRRGVLLGIAQVARGRAQGLAHFGKTPQAFLASLAPLIAFPLVGAALTLSGGGGLAALTEMLGTFCALLAPPVISYWLARAWDREALWLHFATAFNWCQWVIPVVGVVLMLLFSFLVRLGASGHIAGALVLVALLAYAIWLHWFIARQALRISGLRAAVLVILVNLGTAAILILPRTLNTVAHGSGG